MRIRAMPRSSARWRAMFAGVAHTRGSSPRCGWPLESEAAMFEVERYELHSGPAYRFEPDRRDFCKLLGGGLVILAALGDGLAQESGAGRSGNAMPQDVGAWLHIGEDSRITVLTGKVEVGQNARTALTQAVAEELRAPTGSIHIVMGDTDLTPFDMGTFGSRTTPTMAPQLRRAAAAARELLLDLAAERWKADRSTLHVENGAVRNGATSIAFGELTKGKDLAASIGSRPLRQPLGESLAEVGGR